nr:MAG TPA: hypothetical protein [Caudoviricetes sp.]
MPKQNQIRPGACRNAAPGHLFLLAVENWN